MIKLIIWRGGSHVLRKIKCEICLTDTDIQEVNVKKKMMKVASKKILLVENYKFNKVGLYKVADIESLDLIISNEKEQSKALLEEIKSKGVKIVF